MTKLKSGDPRSRYPGTRKTFVEVPIYKIFCYLNCNRRPAIVARHRSGDQTLANLCLLTNLRQELSGDQPRAWTMFFPLAVE